MKFALKDSMVERASGRTVEGGERSEVTELWTFMRARRQLGCSRPSSRLDGRKFVCRAGKWHSPRGGCATSIGSCPSANIEPRYNIALEAVSAASGC
jgi:hypothetical protein